MENILVIGAGFVASPLVKYLLDQPNFKVKVASLIFKEAKEIVNNHPRGESKQLDLNDTDALKEEISKTDIVVSIVPYKFHPKIAEICILYKKPMITTSYVSEEMRKLNSKARDAGILILNELGLDPGIDHMEAMRIIDEVKENGGEVTSFISYCGGLPAPEANTNPFGYKFSWSPIGVLLASKNSARYLKDGKEVIIESEDLFKNYDIVSIEKLGDFEGYPNRDSIPYIDLYKIPETKTMFRGTLRNKGWCHKMQKIVELGLLDEEKKDWIGLNYEGFIKKLINNTEEIDIKKALSIFLNVDIDSDVIKSLEWLNLLSDEPLPMMHATSALDIFASKLLQKLQYEDGERDMIILQHRIEASYTNGKKERITSTLIDYGIPHGDFSMSRTVGLPAAIGTKLILDKKVSLTGVHIPVHPAIYRPVLKELKELGISFKEQLESY